MKRDGPSLWIHEPGKAGRRVPARLVSRVVVIGNVRLDTDALTLFTACGVPITFMDHGGRVLGAALAYDIRPEDFRDRQHALAEDQEAATQIELWMEGARRKGRLDMVRRFAPSFAREFESLGFRELDYINSISVLCAEEDACICAVVGAVSGLLHELALENILGLSLDPHAGIVYRRENFGLSKDIVYMLAGEVDWQVISFFQARQHGELIQRCGSTATLTGKGTQAVIQQFEDRRPALENKIGSLLDGYFQFLRGIEPATVF